MLRSLLFAVALTASAQTPDTFELATIKLSDPLSTETSFHYDALGGIKAQGTTLKDLVLFAYDLRDYQLSGASGWMDSTRYAVVGRGDRAAKNVPLSVVRKRLQALLKERFQLATHSVSKDLPLYRLVIAKGGAKLQRNTAAPGPGGTSGGPAMYRGTAIPIDELARALANITGRPVRNETALDGLYDVNLHWTPDTAREQTGPSLFTAIQEQLGLKLEAGRGPVEILVIDRAERPSEN